MLQRHTEGDVELLTLDRADRRNALDRDLCAELRGAVADAAGLGRRALVITGAGTTFCSGADFGDVYLDGFRDALYGALYAIRDSSLPVIAAVNGPAIGAGTQLALACDLRVASPAAVFAIPTARIGLAVDPWTITRLASLVGAGAAAGLLIGCRQIDAQEALGIGLAQRTGDLDAALEWARDVAGMAPLTLAYSKLVLNSLAPAESDARLREAFERCWLSADLREGEAARRERRAPRFLGA